jgi:hypothetical protein
MDVFDCLEVIDAETSMADRQGNAEDRDNEGAGLLRELHLLRQDGEVDQA